MQDTRDPGYYLRCWSLTVDGPPIPTAWLRWFIPSRFFCSAAVVTHESMVPVALAALPDAALVGAGDLAFQRLLDDSRNVLKRTR